MAHRITRRMIQVELTYREPLRTLLPRLYRKGGIRNVAAALNVNPKTADRWLALYNVPRRRWIIPHGIDGDEQPEGATP